MSEQAAGGGSPLVLVVSELAQECAALTDVLMMDGYRVAAAATVEQALTFADQVMPDLILFDLPESQESESFRIARLLKSDPRTSSILVVAIVGPETAGQHQEGVTDSVDAILSHPWSMSTLLPKLHALIDKAPALAR